MTDTMADRARDGDAQGGPAETLEQLGRREQSKAANRQAILSAARRVFAQLGYEAASVRDIIRGTDLASGTFYNYFKSKEEVFEALADDGARRFRPILRAQRERATSFEDYLSGAVHAYFTFLVGEHRSGGHPTLDRGPHVRANTPEMIAVYEEVRDGVADAIARGLAPRVDPDFVAAACIGVAQEVGDVMLKANPPDVARATQFVTAFILGGVTGGAAASQTDR
ncbi:MAG: TetR/AcrR family transcriptional regulator [Hyphomonadaceae bacterium]|nr:TetR/AcrR family transcriptional regulator [Hyphomonadaceae bacterium]